MPRSPELLDIGITVELVVVVNIIKQHSCI
jgi:hypothetical protein